MTEPAPTTLLLVDDEPTLREPLAEYLTRQGFVVQEAESAVARDFLAVRTPAGVVAVEGQAHVLLARPEEAQLGGDTWRAAASRAKGLPAFIETSG